MVMVKEGDMIQCTETQSYTSGHGGVWSAITTGDASLKNPITVPLVSEGMLTANAGH